MVQGSKKETSLSTFINAKICVLTNDGRSVVGILRGFDQTTNLILEDSHERVYSTTAGVEKIPLGLYIMRGDNIAVVGELDEEIDSSIDLEKIRADPLLPVVH